MEQTLFLIKPDAVRLKIIGKIISEIEEKQILIKKLYLTRLNIQQARDLYIEHLNKNFYNELINFIISGPIVVLVLEGDNVIKKVRSLIGHTNFKIAEKNTIRQKYATSLIQNIVHVSDSKTSFEREINIFL